MDYVIAAGGDAIVVLTDYLDRAKWPYGDTHKFPVDEPVRTHMVAQQAFRQAHRPQPSQPPMPLSHRVSSAALQRYSLPLWRHLSKLRNAPDTSHQPLVLPGWSHQALYTMLSAMHGPEARSRIPRTLQNHDVLCQIASAVLLYQIDVALFRDFSPGWIRDLAYVNDPFVGASAYWVPRDFGRDLMMWIFIAWVFGDAGIFRDATARAIRTVNLELKPVRGYIGPKIIGTYLPVSWGCFTDS